MSVSPYKLASVLLQYPTMAMFDGLGQLREAAGGGPRASRAPFGIFIEWLSRTSPDAVARHYVETFDLPGGRGGSTPRRQQSRCALYLTYYRYGDTRKRGMAMLSFKAAYRARRGEHHQPGAGGHQQDPGQPRRPEQERWLVWIVATQSLSISAAILIQAWPSQSALLAPVAAALWSVGLVLYLMVVVLIVIHWLTVPMTPATLGPPYWILMGATAISVLAGARLLVLPADLPVVRATSAFVSGFAFALWSFGTWWIPLLVIVGVWRHAQRHWPLTYDPTLWSVVFPLGMYSVATLTYGKTTHLTFMEPLARFMFWVSVAAWVAVAAAFLTRLARGRKDLRPSSSGLTLCSGNSLREVFTNGSAELVRKTSAQHA